MDWWIMLIVREHNSTVGGNSHVLDWRMLSSGELNFATAGKSCVCIMYRTIPQHWRDLLSLKLFRERLFSVGCSVSTWEQTYKKDGVRAVENLEGKVGRIPASILKCWREVVGKFSRTFQEIPNPRQVFSCFFGGTWNFRFSDVAPRWQFCFHFRSSQIVLDID